MKVNAKGQVTIPLHIRQKMGILPGTEVEFVKGKEGIYLQKTKETGRGPVLLRQMTGRGTVNMTTDEILSLTRANG